MRHPDEDLELRYIMDRVKAMTVCEIPAIEDSNDREDLYMHVSWILVGLLRDRHRYDDLETMLDRWDVMYDVTCGNCGEKLEQVRPGKWQCNNCEGQDEEAGENK